MILLQIVICRVTMQLFLGAVPIILRLFSKARGHLLFSNYSRNNLPKPRDDSALVSLEKHFGESTGLLSPRGLKQ